MNILDHKLDFSVDIGIIGEPMQAESLAVIREWNLLKRELREWVQENPTTRRAKLMQLVL